MRLEGVAPATASLLAGWDPYDQNASASFFDPEWMFGVDDGFDVVIANPPYVRQEQLGDLKLLLKGYDSFTGMADLYVYFYERGLRLLKTGGVLTYISSNKFFRAGYGEKLRRYLAANATVRQLIDFGDAPVFTAIAYPCIIVATKESLPRNSEHSLRTLTWELGPPVEEFAGVFERSSFLLLQKELTPDGWRLESPATLRLLEKLRAAGTPLGEYVKGRFYYGIKTGLNEAFVVDRATRDRLIAEHPSSADVLKPFLRGRDVKRWRIDSTDLWLCYVGWATPIKKYPAILSHLNRFEADLKARPEVRQGRVPWYALSRYAADYWKEFEQPKIIIPAIISGVSYAPDKLGHFSNDKTSICVTNEVNYLLGLLNSQLLWWFIQQIAATKQGGFYEFKPMYVSQIPIPKAVDPKPIEALVTQILAAKAKSPMANVAILEREIDQIVYRLYGLTKDEIKLVEEATTKGNPTGQRQAVPPSGGKEYHTAS